MRERAIELVLAKGLPVPLQPMQVKVFAAVALELEERSLGILKPCSKQGIVLLSRLRLVCCR